MRVMRSYLHGDTEWSQQKFIDIHIYMFNGSDSSDVYTNNQLKHQVFIWNKEFSN